MYSKTTNGVTVTVTPYFLDDQSSLKKVISFGHIGLISKIGKFFYKIKSRNWLIIDANGKVINVHGDGVVGEFLRLNLVA